MSCGLVSGRICAKSVQGDFDINVENILSRNNEALSCALCASCASLQHVNLGALEKPEHPRAYIKASLPTSHVYISI